MSGFYGILAEMSSIFTTVVATPAALKALEAAGQAPADFLDRHVRGDWGEVSKGDARAQ
jgi:hypothetical protein